MIFAAKPKGYFVEHNDHAVLLARTSALKAPLVVEELAEAPLGDAAGLEAAMRRVQPKRAPSGYLNAVCGVNPARRVVRRATLDLKRLKEAAYFAEVLSSQFRVESEKYTIYALNAPDGSDLDVNKAVQKEALFCGLPTDDIVLAQDGLLVDGIFPDRLELTSVATLGAVVDYLAFKKSKTPTLVLEVGNDATHSFIVSSTGVETSRPIPQGLNSMVPVVQEELGLKDEESAKKLFFSNTFDFTGMGAKLIRRLLKELQSSIGFYEVQTGQSVGQVLCTGIPPKLAWLDATIANALGIGGLKLELAPWLQSRQITVAPAASSALDTRWLGILALMVQYSNSDAAPTEKKA